MSSHTNHVDHSYGSNKTVCDIGGLPASSLHLHDMLKQKLVPSLILVFLSASLSDIADLKGHGLQADAVGQDQASETCLGCMHVHNLSDTDLQIAVGTLSSAASHPMVQTYLCRV